MKRINTDRIGKLIKESIKDHSGKVNVNLIEAKRLGDKTYGIINEYGNFVIKRADKTESVIEEDFKYINGELNRHKFMRPTIEEAKRFMNFYISEQARKNNFMEDEESYVIKKEVESQSDDSAEDDMDMDVDQEDQAQDIETDLEEYQELTGKLSYIMKNVDDNVDDVVKYVFNSLIASLPEIESETASSIKSKLESKLEGSEESEDDMEMDDNESGEEGIEERLKRKGYVVSESLTKEEVLAFMGDADKSNTFNMSPTRFYDGETKEPHMKKGTAPKAKEPFTNDGGKKSKDHPYDGDNKTSKDHPYEDKAKEVSLEEALKSEGIDDRINQIRNETKKYGVKKAAINLLDVEIAWAADNKGQRLTNIDVKSNEKFKGILTGIEKLLNDEAFFDAYNYARKIAKKHVNNSATKFEESSSSVWEDIDRDDPRKLAMDRGEEPDEYFHGRKVKKNDDYSDETEKNDEQPEEYSIEDMLSDSYLES